LALLFVFGGSLFSVAHPPTFQASHPLDIGKYGLVGLLQNGAIGVAGVFQFLGIVGFWASVVLTVLSLIVLLLALVLFFTGRGIVAHRLWARIAGIVFCVLGLLFGWSILFNVSREVAAAIVLLSAAAVYSLWTLGWRYSAPRY